MNDPNYDLGVMGKYLRESGMPTQFLGLPSAVVVQEKRLPDISFYQGKPNFDIMRTQTDALFVRLGQNTWPDPEFPRNWSEARRVGMKRGGYHFCDDRKSPEAQATQVVGQLRADPPEMELAADWENTYGGPFSGLHSVVTFLKAIQAGLPLTKLALYTGYYWFKDHVNVTKDAADLAWLRDNVRLWLGWYAASPSGVLIPAPWTKITYWQYGTPVLGEQYGVETKEIDMNFYNGTAAEFAAEYGGAVEPPQSGGTMIYGTVTPGIALNIRNGPGTTWPDIGDLSAGDMLEASEKVGVWWHLVKVNGIPVTLDSWASEGTTTKYIIETAAPPPSGDVILKSWSVTIEINGTEHVFNG